MNYIDNHCCFRSEYEKGWDKAQRLTVSAKDNSTVVNGLSPFTGYEVSVIAKNGVGESNPSDPSEMAVTDEAGMNL